MKLTLKEVEEMLAKVKLLIFTVNVICSTTIFFQVDADKDGKLKYDEFVKLFIEN